MDYKKAEEKIYSLLKKDENSEKILQNVVDFLQKNFKKYSWVGIYIIEGDDLVLGPWQGSHSTEHTRIPVGEGVCGSAAEFGSTEIVPDVSKDSRYLACFVSTKSEIVVPIIKNGETIGEIDIDSDVKNAFDDGDKLFLESIANKIKDIV
ncbi:MAG: GAF domain-containing protein [Candidatus Thermoplasmatota archaeon]